MLGALGAAPMASRQVPLGLVQAAGRRAGSRPGSTYARQACSISPAASATRRLSSRSAPPGLRSPRRQRAGAELFSACDRIAASPASRASAIARSPTAMASGSPVGQHVQLGLVAVAPAPAAARSPAGSSTAMASAAAASAAGAVAGPPLHPGQPAQVRAERARVAQRRGAARPPPAGRRPCLGLSRACSTRWRTAPAGRPARPAANRSRCRSDQPVVRGRLAVGAGAAASRAAAGP